MTAACTVSDPCDDKSLKRSRHFGTEDSNFIMSKSGNHLEGTFPRRYLTRRRSSSLGTASYFRVPLFYDQKAEANPFDGVCSSLPHDTKFSIHNVEFVDSAIALGNDSSTLFVLELRGAGRCNGGARRCRHNRQIGLELRAEATKGSNVRSDFQGDLLSLSLSNDGQPCP